MKDYARRINPNGKNAHDRANKIKFQERRWAKKSAKETEKLAGHKLYVYKCKWCGFWHITSSKRRDV